MAVTGFPSVLLNSVLLNTSLEMTKEFWKSQQSCCPLKFAPISCFKTFHVITQPDCPLTFPTQYSGLAGSVIILQLIVFSFVILTNFNGWMHI